MDLADTVIVIRTLKHEYYPLGWKQNNKKCLTNV